MKLIELVEKDIETVKLEIENMNNKLVEIQKQYNYHVHVKQQLQKRLEDYTEALEEYHKPTLEQPIQEEVNG